jgi:hypothetical protein
MEIANNYQGTQTGNPNLPNCHERALWELVRDSKNSFNQAMNAAMARQ